MIESVKGALLRIARGLGLFAIARNRMQGRLLILCYHGLSQGDEHRWRPKLFMKSETFQGRLDILRRHRVPVVSLSDGLDRFRRERRTPYAAAITFDDGFQNFASVAMPCLAAAGVPATVYVYTYYSLHPEWPVFDLVVDYMFWTRPTGVVAGSLIGESAPLAAVTPGQRAESVERICAFAEREKLGGKEKDALARAIAAELEFSYDELVRGRRLCLVSGEDLRSIAGRGAYVALHTRRHMIPDTGDGLQRELADNRAALVAMGLQPGADFCYPSGQWVSAMWSVLEQASVRSATTCDPGVARADTSR